MPEIPLLVEQLLVFKERLFFSSEIKQTLNILFTTPSSSRILTIMYARKEINSFLQFFLIRETRTIL
jgi:hypothetical protein